MSFDYKSDLIIFKTKLDSNQMHSIISYKINLCLYLLIYSINISAEDKEALAKQVQELRLELKRLQEDVVKLNQISPKKHIFTF